MQRFTHSFQGVIFDLDGTLVSSNLNFSALRQAIQCPVEQDILHFIAKLPAVQAAQAQRIIEQAEQLDAQQARLLNGTEALLDFLLMQQIPMAIVTRNSKAAALQKVEQNNLPIDLILSREDGPAKPDPTSLIQVATLWGLAADKIAFVGDHHYDVDAANRAGMQSVLLTFDEHKAYQHQARFVYRDLQQLLQAMPLISLCA
ncbi:HAD family hydrolase [Shewanella algidipiscicola]|uniref:HAD family hydrolase n=1 Tax=Shewanella algidipiscicola TaxID=614070 RepID=UPI000D78C8A1|nr:HAD-IA family hydrolase [Shewanella algidipiscicola]